MNKRILCIEDVEQNARLIQRIFYRYPDIIVDHARTLAEARQLLAEPCDLILLDVHLPDGNGFAFIPEARQICPNIPVVLITADASTHLAEQAAALHVGYVTKPIENAARFRQLLLSKL